jgi:N-acetylglutamate synthase-like GNAT family acetyltransferase
MPFRAEIIRPARPHEIEALPAIDAAARARYADLVAYRFVVSAAPIALERFAVGETIVAERDGALVGFALAHPIDGMSYLANISVRPEAGGQGFGAALLDHVMARAAAAGLPAVALATFRAPPWNGPWFRRHGFVTMPEDEIGSGLREILARHAAFLDMSMRETLWRLVE